MSSLGVVSITVATRLQSTAGGKRPRRAANGHMIGGGRLTSVGQDAIQQWRLGTGLHFGLLSDEGVSHRDSAITSRATYAKLNRGGSPGGREAYVLAMEMDMSSPSSGYVPIRM